MVVITNFHSRNQKRFKQAHPHCNFVNYLGSNAKSLPLIQLTLPLKTKSSGYQVQEEFLDWAV